MSRETRGLYDKYKISHTDGTPTDPRAQYFILRVDTDPHARKAVRRYALSVFDDDPLLADSLMNWMRQLDEQTGINTA